MRCSSHGSGVSRRAGALKRDRGSPSAPGSEKGFRGQPAKKAGSADEEPPLGVSQGGAGS